MYVDFFHLNQSFIDRFSIQNLTSRLNLDGTKVGQDVIISSCAFLNGSSARNLSVGEALTFVAVTSGVLDLSFAKIGSNLDVAHAHFADGLDLTHATITGDLVLSRKDSNCTWGREAML